jgi:hypothetical protein
MKQVKQYPCSSESLHIACWLHSFIPEAEWAPRPHCWVRPSSRRLPNPLNSWTLAFPDFRTSQRYRYDVPPRRSTWRSQESPSSVQFAEKLKTSSKSRSYSKTPSKITQTLQELLLTACKLESSHSWQKIVRAVSVPRTSNDLHDHGG